MKTPAKNITAMAAKIAQPWRVSRTILPNVYVKPGAQRKIRNIWSRFEKGVGFSNGWAELALKNPPPLVPSILMASCEAKGPCSITWLAPSRVVAVTGPLKFWMRSLRDEEQRRQDANGKQDIKRAAGHVHPEISDGLRGVPRKSANQRHGHGNSDRGGNKVLDRERRHLDEVAHRGVRRVGLPVGVRHEADRRVERQVRRHRRGALRAPAALKSASGSAADAPATAAADTRTES